MEIGQILTLIKHGGNPQQIAITLLQDKINQNPLVKNLSQLAQAQDEKGIEQIARNICRSQGKDFDEEFAKFKQQLGLK